MAGNLVKTGRKKNPATKKQYLVKYRAGGRLKSMHFNSVNDKAALRYCGFNEKGEACKGGLLKNKLPRGAKIVHVSATGKRAKK